MRYLTPLVALCLVWLVVTEARRCRTGGAPASPVDITLEPEQEVLETPLTREVLRGDRTFRVNFTHRYAISGEVLSASAYDWAWTSEFFDVDLGLVWGPEVEALKERYTFYQNARFLFWRSEGPVSDADRAYLTAHVGNQHLIPAEGRSALDRAIRSASEGDHVRLEGWLVTIEDDTGALVAKSSTRRDDDGGGACEIVWVERFQIGARSWE